MDNTPRLFEIVDYQIASDRLSISFNYKYNYGDGKNINFVEKIILPEIIPLSVFQQPLRRVLDNLHIIIGISYYKLFCPGKIIVPYFLTEEQLLFWKIAYTKGLGEFFYKNKIDFRNLVNFCPAPIPSSRTVQDFASRDDVGKMTLIGIGGGKDSIVAVEMLKKNKKEMTGFIVKNNQVDCQIQEEVAGVMKINYYVVKRELDPKLLKDKLPHAYDGHVPVSAIYAFIGLLLAVIYDYSEIITANEKSADIGNVNYLGMSVNHQWSKSEEFEQMFQSYVTRFITQRVRFHSMLRSFSELQVAEMFIQHEKYFPVFSSCNRNFSTKKRESARWCGECPKCAFVFLTLAAYLSKEKIIKIFNKNLFDDEKLLPLFKDLLGRGEMKPFECVGTFEEANQALDLVVKNEEFSQDIIIKQL